MRQLCAQIERILAVRDCVEMVSSETAVKMTTMVFTFMTLYYDYAKRALTPLRTPT